MRDSQDVDNEVRFVYYLCCGVTVEDSRYYTNCMNGAFGNCYPHMV